MHIYDARLLRTFVFCAISPYNSYLHSIFGTNALIWGHFKNVPFLRPLRLKNNRDWILRLRRWNFVISSESLAANFEKVRQTFVWQTVPNFWFIWLWYLPFCITYKSKSLRNNKKTNQSELWNHLSFTFSRLAAKLSELITKIRGCSPKFNLDHNCLKNSTVKQ